MVNQVIQKKGKQPIRAETKPAAVPASPSGVVDYERRLSDGFSKAGFEEGIKAFQSIKKEYDALKPLLYNREALNPLVNVDRVKKLTEELYMQGLTLLLKTLDLSQQIGSTNVTTVALENKELQEALEKQSPDSTLHAMIKERLEKNTKSLKLIKGHRDRLDEIFCRAGLCKNSIREIRLELPEIMSHRAQDELDKILLELNTRIEFAQRVQEEYKRQGL